MFFPPFFVTGRETIKLPFEDNSIDAVLLLAVLTCVYKDQEQDSILNEIKRVLKPNGIIYINDFLLNDDERILTRYKKYKDKYKTYGVFELPEGAILRHHNRPFAGN
ncbi:methyltransferase domain-containing protein [Sporolactobacillus sp. CQH2019]|uniref:methyltransferase domain-containing protein n=1 Tax=Sporolactobacillus sp. CQH2019 TaxID=3023512 RepID=UPI002368E305|nr:methyltransferase domain-containing protein [Sporolactobacillus sp. CQH2019]MDD9150850.1 methyltransferase domain-containing protein [Sporolactobacillus sp. CQH2019]